MRMVGVRMVESREVVHVLRRREEERRVLLVMQVRMRVGGTWRGNIPRHSHHASFHSHSPSYSPASQSLAASHVHVRDVQKAARKSRTSITPCPCRSHTSPKKGEGQEQTQKNANVIEREGLGDC
jgi:hypothetical protein